MGADVGTVGKVRLNEGPSVVGNTIPSQHSLNALPHSVPNLFIRLHGSRAALATRPNEQHWQHSCRNKHAKYMALFEYIQTLARHKYIHTFVFATKMYFEITVDNIWGCRSPKEDKLCTPCMLNGRVQSQKTSSWGEVVETPNSLMPGKYNNPPLADHIHGQMSVVG